MTTPSKVTSTTPKTRTRRKAQPPTIYPLSRYEIEHRTHVRASRELSEFIASLTEAEKRVIGHVKPFGDPGKWVKRNPPLTW